ncbi:universal stress protein [Kitasatospora kifunensis]|uniref:Nucleotide-binding universal stress UspA family protein n=1 Tax=Kitasatospora kifunensis TaxID=58351 RepID=A0A7W7VYE4_KITKI|nr:universal stress protein [Kitasatospora kifunensis]MBB4927451.1 nucleotide-binding universal stress UspA family protein [Kitasatospora kifunensis]
MTEDTRIVVGVSGSPSSPTVLRRAFGEALQRDAVLVAVHAWTPAGGEQAYRTHPCPSLERAWEQAAFARLDAALLEAFGGEPVGVRVERVVIRGEAGPSLVQVADGPGDLLVIGTGRRSRLLRLLRGSVSRYCLAHSACAVVAVPPTVSGAGDAADRQTRRFSLVVSV